MQVAPTHRDSRGSANPDDGDTADTDGDAATDADDDDIIPESWSYDCRLGIRLLREAIYAAVIVPIDKDNDSDFLVIREEYIWFREMLEKDATPIVVTGQPGVGKTTFMFDVLLDRLERRLSTAIQVAKHLFIFFDEDGPRFYDGTQEAPRLSEGCWALIDDVESPCTAILISRARIVCALPPNRWPGWAKQKVALTLLTELPRLVEIAAIAKEHSLDVVQAVKIARKWGPCIRTVLAILRTGSDYEILHSQRVKAAAAMICASPPATLVDPLPETTNSKGSSMLFVRPVRYTPPSSDSPIIVDMVDSAPTPHLAHILNQRRIAMSAAELSKLYEILSVHSLAEPYTRWLFEKQMHIRMSTPGSALGIFNVDDQQTMQPATELLAGTASGLRYLDTTNTSYWFPSAANYPGVDGVLVNPRNIYVLQATVAEKDRSPEDGLWKVWKSLGPATGGRYAWHFVAVTDKEALARQSVNRFAAVLKTFRLGRRKVGVTVWGCVL
ncbi:hypothetical protein C8Q76DRAFT_371744 [Earliella scabrosa]|nr:hypothetical protein C8Q76DRAFT_371744 [Earliella scabrosa]